MMKTKPYKALCLAFLIGLICLYTPQLVSAVKPVTQNFIGDFGIDIEILAPINIPPSTNITIHVHTFNKSNGLILSSPEASCEGMLINDFGVKITHQDAGVNGDHFDFILNETMATTNGIYQYTLHCNTSDIGGFHTGYFEVTSNGLTKPGGIVIVFFSIALILILGFMLYELILSFGHFASLDLDVIDVAKSLGIYFALLGLYMLGAHYLGNPDFNSYMLIFIIIGGFTHILIPVIGFFLSIMIGSLRKKKVDFGTKRIYRRQKIGN